MAAGTETILAGKPAILVTVRGGNYDAGTPREGWDHATPWMRRILADVWNLDLTVVEGSFTLVGVNPALDQFRELAAELRQQTESNARTHGRSWPTGSSAANRPPDPGRPVRDQDRQKAATRSRPGRQPSLVSTSSVGSSSRRASKLWSCARWSASACAARVDWLVNRVS